MTRLGCTIERVVSSRVCVCVPSVPQGVRAELKKVWGNSLSCAEGHSLAM